MLPINRRLQRTYGTIQSPLTEKNPILAQHPIREIPLSRYIELEPFSRLGINDTTLLDLWKQAARMTLESYPL